MFLIAKQVQLTLSLSGSKLMYTVNKIGSSPDTNADMYSTFFIVQTMPEICSNFHDIPLI